MTESSLSLELDRLLRGLLQDSSEVTLNGSVRKLIRHDRYCQLLGISGGSYDLMRREDILKEGRSRVYSVSPLSERVLMTSDIPKPGITEVDFTTEPDNHALSSSEAGTASGDKGRRKAEPGPADDCPEHPLPEAV